MSKLFSNSRKGIPSSLYQIYLWNVSNIPNILKIKAHFPRTVRRKHIFCKLKAFCLEINFLSNKN